MAKGCLNKLSGNITVDCTITQNGIKNVYLMYPEDVTLSLGAGYEYVDAVTFVGSAKSYLIEGYKQNIQLSTSARAMDASMISIIRWHLKYRLGQHGLYARSLRGSFMR